ncbi:MAG: hypothetical protein IJC15_04420 [Clostridia bacterium]|nr:hypothetical protein [Clostridia bacterium]
MTKKILKKALKVCACVLGGILLLPVLVIVVLNVAKFAIYHDYYSIKTNVCTNPGLGDNFVCQGIAVYGETEKILVSGYMTDHSASRIYITDPEDNAYYVTLAKANGDAFTGHAGGIAICGDFVYIANGSKLHAIAIADLLAAPAGSSVRINESIPVNNNASFVYADEQNIYVGEFHDGGKYITEHPYETPDGTYYAIVSRYPREEIERYDKTDAPSVTPDKIYSIRNKVQGICFTPDGKVVLSTSYGLTDTVYYVYEEADAVSSGETLDGAPLYYLCDYTASLKGPAMGEDLDCVDGKILTLTESASNKYIFGKLFFANKIVALDFDGLR